jgi:hypothetical protein
MARPSTLVPSSLSAFVKEKEAVKREAGRAEMEDREENAKMARE